MAKHCKKCGKRIDGQMLFNNSHMCNDCYVEWRTWVDYPFGNPYGLHTHEEW